MGQPRDVVKKDAMETNQRHRPVRASLMVICVVLASLSLEIARTSDLSSRVPSRLPVVTYRARSRPYSELGLRKGYRKRSMIRAMTQDEVEAILWQQRPSADTVGASIF
eukprot:452335-Amorphochlora_amoeboformis.AAC.2